MTARKLVSFGLFFIFFTPLSFATEVLPNPCSPLGPQRIAVILASYDGAPADTAMPSTNYVRDLFLGSTQNFSISDLYKTISGSRAWFQSVVFLGPYHSSTPFIAQPDAGGGLYRGLDQWEKRLVDLASKDTDFSQIDRVVFITPNALDQSGKPVMMASGLAGQGVCDLDSVNSQGVHHPLAHAWILARTVYQGIDLHHISTHPETLTPAQLALAIRNQMMSDMAPIAHELGHTFGLGHANQVNRPQANFHTPFMNDEILPAADQPLYQLSYADPFSVMGANEIQWLNLAHLSQLNWLNSNQILEVRTNGTYRIYPLELQDGKVKGLKIPRVIQSANESTVSDLWVEFRKFSTVYDTELGIQHSTNGAIVHYTNPKQPGPNSIWPFETVLLNFHPKGVPVNPYETDLTLTGSWKDEHSLVNLKVVDVTPDYLDIEVSF